MTSIFTGLAFMHGHIVDRELVLRLGRDDTIIEGGTVAQQAPLAGGKDEVKASKPVPVRPVCATC